MERDFVQEALPQRGVGDRIGLGQQRGVGAGCDDAVRRKVICLDQRSSDHAPLTIDYGFDL